MRPFVQLSIFVCYLFPGQSNLLAANAVVERVRQLSLPGSFVGMPIPIWQNGFFLRFDFHPARSLLKSGTKRVRCASTGMDSVGLRLPGRPAEPQ